ncbi:hypothetical protein ABK249_20825 [Neorhizobium sp. Rsf11]|uniref:MobA/VirD2-like nuclease domain-containing protein n=1 Tax=Neorhizobium phenanthreniclasticum TaxID=3157917 RepID=A0ABV0M8K0_9HYPH
MQPLYRRLAEEWLGQRETLLPELSRRAQWLEDDWRRRARASLPPETLGHAGSHAGRLPHERFDRSNEQEMRQRFVGLASGAQPAVVKVVGFGGGTGVRKLVDYVSRGGEVKIENERGETLTGGQAPNITVRDWEPLLSNRKASQDLGLFEIEVSWQAAHRPPEDAGLLIARHAFKDRPFAFAVTQDPQSVRIEGLVVLLSPTEGRLPADRRESGAITARLKETLSREAETVSFQFTGHGHGVRYGTKRLRELVDKHPGQIHDEHARPVADVSAANELVRRRWRDNLGSSRPRDTLHLIISASSGTDAARFQDTVRAFLAEEFKGHRYVFAVHDPVRDPRPQREGGKRPHIHAHAVITTVSDYGDRLKTWVTDLRRWRLSLAENARANGINMEMTDRRETVTAPAYTNHHVRPVNYVGRTEHEGTSFSAQRRYDYKRLEVPHLAGGERSRDYRAMARQNWQALASQGYSETVQQFARSTLFRFGVADRRSSNRRSESVRQLPLTSDRAAGASERFHSEATPSGEPHRGNGETMANAAERSKQDLRELERKLAEGNDRSVSEPIRGPHPPAPRPMPEQKKHAREAAEQHYTGERPDPAASAPESRSLAEIATSVFRAFGRLREAAIRSKHDEHDREVLRSAIRQTMQDRILKLSEIPGSGRIHDWSTIESHADRSSATQGAEAGRATAVPAWQLEQKRESGDRQRDVAALSKPENALWASRERDRDNDRDEYER